MKQVAICEKGGIGKSATTQNLTAALRETGRIKTFWMLRKTVR